MFQLAITICLKPDEKIEISEINKSYKKKQKETMELKKKKKRTAAEILKHCQMGSKGEWRL